MSELVPSSEVSSALLIERFRDQEGVSHEAGASPRRTFGANALKVRGKIFAMVLNHRLVLKLPRDRVEALVAEGVGDRFDRGHDRVMKEWLVVTLGTEENWSPLATEALGFVGATAASSPLEGNTATSNR